MFPALFSSLQVRFLSLLLLAVLPGFGLAFYLGFEHRQQFITRAQEEALQFVRMTAAQQERLIEGERQFLATIAQLPEVLGGDAATCQIRLAALLQQYPRYANLAVVAPDGYISCSALPFIPPLSATRRAWYKRALGTHTFAVGDYQVARISGTNTITLAYPLLGEAHEIRAIVAAAMDLDWLNQVLAEAPPPAGTTLSLIDPNGTIIARYPDPESWVGRSLGHTPLIRTVLLQETGVADLPDLDNVARLFAFRPLIGSGPSASLSVCVGITKAAVFAEADRAFVRILIVLGVVVGLGSVVYWVGADWLILRTLQVLVRTAGEVAAGNLSARTGLSHAQGELGQLARAFDDMAEELETRVSERTAQLQTVNEELEAFSYSVSHDLRAPLRSIDGFSQALLEDYSDRLDTPAQDALQRIRRAAQRMAELIDALLGLARVTRVPLRRVLVDMSALATSIVTDLRRQEPGRSVTFRIADGLTAHADAALLRSVLENVLDNAWKFTAKQDQALIEVGVNLQPSGAEVFFVRDNGAGFDMTYASKLFGAFQRLHQMSDFPGTGVGLATVQRIIHRHGGRIWADAGVGQGATFSFTLSPSPTPDHGSRVAADSVGTSDHHKDPCLQER